MARLFTTQVPRSGMGLVSDPHERVTGSLVPQGQGSTASGDPQGSDTFLLRCVLVVQQPASVDGAGCGLGGSDAERYTGAPPTRVSSERRPAPLRPCPAGSSVPRRPTVRAQLPNIRQLSVFSAKTWPECMCGLQLSIMTDS